jgi:hypothetical protein
VPFQKIAVDVLAVGLMLFYQTLGHTKNVKNRPFF